MYLGCVWGAMLDAAVGCVDRRTVVGWWTLVGRCTCFYFYFLGKVADELDSFSTSNLSSHLMVPPSLKSSRRRSNHSFKKA